MSESVVMTSVLLAFALLGIVCSLWGIQAQFSLSTAIQTSAVVKALRAAGLCRMAGLTLLLLALAIVLMKLFGQEMLEYHAEHIAADLAWLTTLLIVLVALIVVAAGLWLVRRTKRWVLVVLFLNGLIVLSGGVTWSIQIAGVDELVAEQNREFQELHGQDYFFNEASHRLDIRTEKHRVFILPALALVPGLSFGILATLLGSRSRSSKEA